MDLIGDLAAIHVPVPQPGDVTPEELYPDALAEAEQTRADYAFALEAQHDDQREDPLLIALGNAAPPARPPTARSATSSPTDGSSTETAPTSSNPSPRPAA